MPIRPRRRRNRIRPLQRLDSVRAQRMRAEAISAARRARNQALLIGPMFAGVLLAYHYRERIAPGYESAVQIPAVIALVILGWALARDLGQVIGPPIMDRLDAATAGTVGFVVRLVGIAVTVLVALRIAGLPPQTLAVGGALSAVVVGLAAQQTLGNLFAGTVLLSARPFRVGERIRFQGGGIAGTVEGTVSALGLLYVTLADGAERIMVPNSIALGCAVTPLREPDAVDLVARLRPDVRPSDLQRMLEEGIQTPTSGAPHIELRSVDDDEVVVRITAVPVDPDDGWRLADEVLATVGQVTSDKITMEHVVGGDTDEHERARTSAGD